MRKLLLYMIVPALVVPFLAIPAAHAGATLEVGAGKAFTTIQAAVDAAQPGDLVFVYEGVYGEAVSITTPGITVRGECRTCVILEGSGALPNGFAVVADGVSLESMTAQNYVENGFFFSRVTGFRMHDLHAHDNAVYGLYAIHSTDGDIGYSYADGHGDGGVYIGETFDCDCDVHHNEAWNNMLGYSGTANSWVRIHDNNFHDNRAGILMSVLPNEMGFDEEAGELYGTQVHTSIYDNWVHDNNNKDVPESGIWETVHVPVGEGITIAGGWFNDIHGNTIENNNLWGVGIFWLSTPPRANHVFDNDISGSRYGIWWDEWGENHCFDGNAISDVEIVSDPATLPACDDLAGALPCDAELAATLSDWAACRANDVRAPSALKDADLATRSLADKNPDESLI